MILLFSHVNYSVKWAEGMGHGMKEGESLQEEGELKAVTRCKNSSAGKSTQSSTELFLSKELYWPGWILTGITVEELWGE